MGGATKMGSCGFMGPKVMFACAKVLPRLLSTATGRVTKCTEWTEWTGYPKYLVEYFLADTLFGSGVWLDLYHPCFISFLLFHTFQTHVSKREKPTLRKFLHWFLDFTSNFIPPHCFFVSFTLFLALLCLSPNPRIITITLNNNHDKTKRTLRSPHN